MSFSQTLHYANIVTYPKAELRPDMAEGRSLKRRIMDSFHENKADKMAIILRVTNDKGTTLAVTMTDTPDPQQNFPYGCEIIKQRPIENFKSNLREPHAGKIKSIGFEFGVMMTRHEFHKKKSIFTRYQDFIREDNLIPVIPA
jgi:hypothetical protein